MSAEARDDTVRPVGLLAQDSADGAMVGMAAPRLSWRLEADRPAVRQLGYEIQLAGDAGFSSGVETSGHVASTSPVAAGWPGVPLSSREARFARVRVWTERGSTDWSPPLRLEAALLDPSDWTARPVSPRFNVAMREPGPAPLLRRGFVVDRPVEHARLYVTSLGVHETWLNGERVGDAVLDPGWTAYQQRLLYAAYDVTDLLQQGENVVSAAVGDGWWRGHLTWFKRRAVYGDTTALLAQLEIRFADGTEQVIGTDGAWRGASGAILAADLYDGASMDLRKELTDWRRAGFDDQAWEAVETLAQPKGLELRGAPPVRVVDSWPLELHASSWGTWIADCGQNLAGYVKLRVRGPSGSTITVRHAELLGPEGRLFTEALRTAAATDRYVLAGEAVELTPPFTFHGFRYVEIECDPGVKIEAAEVCALSSDLRQTGEFACSDPRLDKLFQNVRWSQLGNFLALPTDCPQRDERMGWTGDIQVFAPTACANADARTFLNGWLKDLAIEQRPDGCVAVTVPHVLGDHPMAWGAVGWGDAATLTPWVLYEAYGDIGVLERQYPSMSRWVNWCASRRGADGFWTGDFQFGDWLDPGAPPDRPQKATTRSDYVTNAYLAHSARTLSRAALLLGKIGDAQVYRRLGDQVADATWRRWREHALTTQAGCAIAVMFDICPEPEVAAVAAQLAALVEAGDGRIATGFLGTPLLLPALTRGDQIDAAYRLLLNEACPGWLYQVKLGATTMWERWDAIRPDGSIHPGAMASGEGASMLSFNHYAYGAVAEWLYRSVAGLAPVASDPGYGLIAFAPRPGGGLSHARASIETPYGRAAIAWRVDEDASLRVELDIPPGARGRFDVPRGWELAAGAGPLALASGRHELVLRRTP
ncbi:MAG: hydrolase [Phenylobacterium sp.]|uniref:alpha-L-rhamnosidase n=1 Tax=Phenylobacterium sp. TaxID=1871053 RepID=UPI0025CF9EE3|nr:alpha-L-rhamnosidase [Phenylobacterium sp.]MBA4010297.1 hydrolase [Phenylobacterium sp.]